MFCSPNSNPSPKEIFGWNVDIRFSFFVEIMSANSFAKIPQIPKNLSEAQQKKSALDVRSPCLMLVFENRKELHCIAEYFFSNKSKSYFKLKKKTTFYSVVLKTKFLSKNFPTNRFYGNQLCSHQSPQVVSETVRIGHSAKWRS